MSRAQSGLGLLTEQFLSLSGSFNSLSQRQRTRFYLSLAGFMIPSEQQMVAAKRERDPSRLPSLHQYPISAEFCLTKQELPRQAISAVVYNTTAVCALEKVGRCVWLLWSTASRYKRLVDNIFPEDPEHLPKLHMPPENSPIPMEYCTSNPSRVCGCCGALRPRYKRLVDNIFPEDPEDGLVKTNMEKLTFYALSAPEKLDRIGAYLSEKLIRDVGRHRYGRPLILDVLLYQPTHRYVCIAMEALDQLLMACHCQSINLFVESFLKMVAKLLESEKPDLQILGTNSFVKIRMSGIKGLQGVVRKTVNDELQANIWDPQHMDKIVPSLLFNLQHAEEAESRSPSPLQTAEKEKENPAELAERCLRELLGRAAYGNIKNAIKPVLIHLDNHSLWEPNTFAIRCFKIIMYSIQPQHSHLVIQQLLSHLDANSKSAATVRAGIVEVLSEAAIIAASGSVGPTVLEVFNTLLRQLRLSIDYALTGSYDCVIAGGTKIIKEHEERMFQEAIIKTTGSFASTLPTYQRSEVMLFIMSKVPLPSLHHPVDMGKAGENRNRLTQIMLLKSLLQ
ncbi:hypothetical protein E2320_018417, partial [Naja naja]